MSLIMAILALMDHQDRPNTLAFHHLRPFAVVTLGGHLEAGGCAVVELLAVEISLNAVSAPGRMRASALRSLSLRATSHVLSHATSDRDCK